jgi:DNA-binding beta-propeller fold protein YncE
VSLPVDPAWTGIAMAASGLVAWRADQSLVVLDGDGATVARLGTDPGERIVSVAVAGDRAAVLLDGGGKRGVRMVALDAPAWGAWRDLGTDTADLVALAASGQFAVRDSNTATVYDATGTLVRTLHAAGAGSLAFVDDTHLAMSANGTLQWLAIGKQPAMASGIVNATVVAAGGRAIAGASGDLVLATPAETRYLGYDVPVPSVARAAGGGQLVVASMAKLYTVDDHLRVVAAPNLPVREHALELQWLGDDAWAAETALIGDESGDFRLIDHGTAHVLRKQLDVTYVLGYEPTTHLLTLSLGASSAVYRYDPVKHELALVAVEPASNMYMEVELIPLDPARAGAQLLQVTSHGATRLDWLPDATKLEEPGASVRVSGSLAAADPAGNAYVWVSTAQGMELDVYRDGKRVGTLPTDGPVSVWPDPAGGRIVEIAPHAVSMVTTAGQRAWTMQLDRPTSAVWLSDGALAIVTAAGIVRVEPATGNVMATRCGWGFGLSATPHASPPAIEPVCSQLEGAD